MKINTSLAIIRGVNLVILRGIEVKLILIPF